MSVTRTQVVRDLRHFNNRFVLIVEAIEQGDWSHVERLVIDTGEDFDAFTESVEAEWGRA